MISISLAFLLQKSDLKDLQLGAAPVEQIVDQLAKVYRSSMDVSPLLKGKIILIEANQVSEPEVREQVAKVLNASWERRGEVWHLLQSAKQQAHEGEAGTRMRLGLLKKTFQLREETEGSTATFSPQFAAKSFHQRMSEEKTNDPNKSFASGITPTGYGLPDQRLMSRVLKKFGLKKISEVANGHRLVYSLKPNRMQLQLDIDIAEDIEKYKSEETLWMDTMMRLSKDQESRAKRTDLGQVDNRVFIGGSAENDSWSSHPINGDIQNLLFSIYCGMDGSYSVDLTVIPLDKKEKILTVNANSYEGAFAGVTQSDLNPPPAPDFILSEISKDFKSFMESDIATIPASRRKASLTAFADPVTREPLSYGFSEVLQYASRKSKKNIIAILGDSSINTFDPSFCDLFFGDKLSVLTGEMIVKEGNWIRMGTYPFEEPSFPRQDLKRIIARVRANRRVGIEDRAEIAAQRPRIDSVSNIERYIERFVENGDDGGAEIDALKLIGLLSNTERQAASRKEGVLFTLLNPKLRNHLFECCFYNAQNKLHTPDYRSQDWRSLEGIEPTFTAPSGITANSVLRVIEETKNLIKSAGEGSLKTDARGWGSTKYQVEHPGDYPGNNFTLDLKAKLHVVRQTLITFKLSISRTAEWMSLIEMNDQTDGSEFTLDTMPESMKVEFENGYKDAATAAKLRREMLKKKDGGGGTARQK